MLFFFGFWLPAALFIGLLLGFVILLMRRHYHGLKLGALFFCLSIGTFLWANFQSRSSTAAIDLLVLPGLASICAFLAWVAVRSFSSSNKRTQIAGWICLSISVSLLGFNIFTGLKRFEKNKKHDTLWAEYYGQVAENKKQINNLLKKHQGNEIVALQNEIKAHINDSAFLLAALETPYVSSDLLEELSQFHGMNEQAVVREVIKNEKTSPELLQKIYSTAQIPYYFAGDLARNKNTPKDVLRELFKNPIKTGDVARWLAQNPSTPHDILIQLASSGDGDILRWILANPELDCEMLQLVKSSLTKVTHYENTTSHAIIKVKELKLCNPHIAKRIGASLHLLLMSGSTNLEGPRSGVSKAISSLT